MFYNASALISVTEKRGVIKYMSTITYHPSRQALWTVAMVEIQR